MALITTFEGVQNPITVNDLFNVNDYMGVRMFGPDAWPQVKQAAAIIAQRAANAPILFFLRSQGTTTQAAGQSSELGRQLWGYNDRAGVELLGAAAWGAVKNEFDELLGWNPFSTLKKVGEIALTPITWTADKLTKTNLPVLKQVGQTVKFVTSAGTEFSPITTGERLTNLAQNKGYVTQAEIDEAYEIEKAAQRNQMLKDQANRASKAASEAAKAQAAAEKAQAEYQTKLEALEQAAKAQGVDTSAVVQAQAQDNTSTIIWVLGAVGITYLITRKK
jgi:hypothetical protein